MYNIILQGVGDKYDYEALIQSFLMPSEYHLRCVQWGESFKAIEENEAVDRAKELVFSDWENKAKNQRKRELFKVLAEQTGKKPQWGIMTGVRPVKLAGELIRTLGKEKAEISMVGEYLLQPEKAKLLIEIYDYQQERLELSPENEVALYVSIPFCPTRCLYCSFPSNQVKEKEILPYLVALKKEITFVGESMGKSGLKPETIYIGGGTPTTLTAPQLDELLGRLRSALDCSEIKEFTVEAGRADTIDREKLQVFKNHGVGRISINPQTMQGTTLERIGRGHDKGEIHRAFQLAKEMEIPIINADFIAGLPGEDPEDFVDSLNQIMAYEPENITLHTLAVKRASRLIDEDPVFNYKQGERVSKMLEEGQLILRNKGYKPYYLYRQKHMAGDLENVGWCKEGTEGIYNIRIMEEAQTTVALGAGGISKAYYPKENRLERIPNVTNFEIYIERIDEMLMRKQEKLFY